MKLLDSFSIEDINISSYIRVDTRVFRCYYFKDTSQFTLMCSRKLSEIPKKSIIESSEIIGFLNKINNIFKDSYKVDFNDCILENNCDHNFWRLKYIMFIRISPTQFIVEDRFGNLIDLTKINSENAKIKKIDD